MRPIGDNYGDRGNVQNCELVGLADLNTGKDYVRGRIAGYLNDLLSLGVAGFRIDAVKHIPARRPRQHQVPAHQPERLLEAGGDLRKPASRSCRTSTGAPATSRSSATAVT